MNKIVVTEGFSWLNLDSWSETYIGARWLIENVLPERQHEAIPEHGPISQMVLLGAHQMIEIILFNSIRSRLEGNPELSEVLDTVVKKIGFNDALKKWPKLTTGTPLPLGEQPMQAVSLLHQRRNATIHYQSALTTLEMARAAFHTATIGSIVIDSHFNPGREFKYCSVIAKYPPLEFDWLASSMYPENIG